MYTDLIVHVCVPEIVFVEPWISNTNAYKLLQNSNPGSLYQSFEEHMCKISLHV